MTRILSKTGPGSATLSKRVPPDYSAENGLEERKKDWTLGI